MTSKNLVEIDLTLAENGSESDRRALAKLVVDQFYEIGFLRCTNIPGYDEKALLEASNWFHLEHTKELFMNKRHPYNSNFTKTRRLKK